MVPCTASADQHQVPSPLTFGIYAGSRLSEESSVHPDIPVRIMAALARLQPANRPFLVRCYLNYTGNQLFIDETPQHAQQYAVDGRKLDLALCYCTPDGDLDDWTSFVRVMVRRYGSSLAQLQIAEEPNNPHAAMGGNGSFPRVREAIIAGVIAAKNEAQQHGYTIQVGFNATPSFDPNDDFWPSMAALGSPAFIEALDYVGLDFFPDVFRPLPRLADGSILPLEDAVAGVLTQFRTVNLRDGCIPATIPMHITENGWPTSPSRSYTQQAQVLETILRVIDSQRQALNIAYYAYHGLRDIDSTSSALQFGLLRDDYTPKPAFACYRQLIAEMSMDV